FPANTYLSTITYKSTDFGSGRTITETEPASGLWYPDPNSHLACDHQNPLGTSAGDYSIVSDLQASLNLKQADSYSCTFHNNKKVATQLTTDAGGPYTVGTNGTYTLTDTATLSGGTTSATGTITFSLYADDGNGGCIGSAI